MNLILLEPEELDDRGLATLSDGRAEHISRVLKAEAGSKIRIGVVNGAKGTAEVIEADSHRVVIQCILEAEEPPKPQVDLLLAMPRPKVMKRLWAQLSALGVGRIILVNAEKVERFYFDSHAVDPELYRPRLIEGLQQARCTHLPEVFIRQRFKPFVEDELERMFPDSIMLLADPSGTERITDYTMHAERVLLAIGPEGGWTPYELSLLEEKGFRLFSMGERILRTDTACIGLITLVSDMLDRPGTV